MKKIFSILCTALALSVVSCNGTRSKSDTSADTTTETSVDTIAPTYTLTDNGISDIVLGMPTSNIPDSIAGLYDRVEKYEGKDFVGYSLLLDSIETLNAEDSDFDGKINLIALRGESPLKADTPSGLIFLGLPESDLLKLKGIDMTKSAGGYHIGPFKIYVQDGKVSEIYIEWSPSQSNELYE